jgi:alkylated DNA repair dioxygenase AlkB
MATLAKQLTLTWVEVLINHDGALAVVIRNWLGPSSMGQDLHNRLLTELPWIQAQMNMYGKIIDIPRAMFFLGDPHIKTYSYSRLTFPVQSWTQSTPLYAEIEAIRTRIQSDPQIIQLAGQPLHFDSSLLNLYRNGDDKIDPHSDKEALGILNAVVTVSLAGSREFVFKSKTKGPDGRYPTIKTTLNNCDLVLMLGRCQELYTHSIPRSVTQESRISLTFRLIQS